MAAATGTLGAEVSDIEEYSHGGTGWGAGRVRLTTGDGQVAWARYSAAHTSGDRVAPPAGCFYATAASTPPTNTHDAGSH